MDSYIWKTDTIKNLVFLSIATWGELSQHKVVSSLGISVLNNSVMSSISSNLEAGKRSGLYRKSGSKKFARFSLEDDFVKSKQMARVRFLPSQQAVRIARARAKNNASPKSKA